MDFDDLTPKQKETLEFIIEYIKRNSVAPTYTEISKKQKITLKSVFQRIHQLKKKGYINIKKNVPRAITLTEKCRLIKPTESIEIKVFSKVYKFKNTFKLDNLEKTIFLSTQLLSEKEVCEDKIFGIQCNDENTFSELGIGKSTTSIILVEKTKNISEGCCVVCLYESRVVIGTLRVRDKFKILEMNSQEVPIGGSNALLIGKLRSIIKVF